MLFRSRGIHPDLIFIDKEKDRRDITVDQVRALKSDAIVMPNEADRKIYVINDAGSMNQSAQNAMLKLLEEPPKHAAFILATENPAQLLPTVRSRCVEIKLQSVNVYEGENAHKFFDALSEGALSLMAFSFTLGDMDKTELSEFLLGAKELTVLKLRSAVSGGEPLSPEYLALTAAALDRAAEYLEFNLGAGYIAGMLCAELIELK